MKYEIGIQTYQILTNDDEDCIPCLSSILLAVRDSIFIRNSQEFQIRRGQRDKKIINLKNSIEYDYRGQFFLYLLNMSKGLICAKNPSRGF